MKKILLPPFECGSVLLGEKEQPYGPDYTFDEMREITTEIFSFESIRKNDILYVTPNKAKAKNSDIGNSTTIWVSVTSILVSIASLVVNIVH